MEEERRMKEGIALEEEMRVKKERWLVEEQIRHVQEEHKMRMKEQKCLSEEICKKADEEVLVFKSERSQILNVDPDAVAQPVAVEEEKGLSRDSSNVPPISAEDETYEIKEKPKLPKRKLKELSRMSVTSLKASNNIVIVPQYWSFKREYSQNKRGIGKLAWKLPGFIKRIGIGKVRQSLRDREDQETTKVKMRKRVRLKLKT
ncbi:splicing factor 3B subunit [Trichonephila inaurata madagascariensis]|uniref:Splicing factor 3B subunit n=1 Tax=Trichonephila inaurata madagascariensis TaxID=2747483 RepID=A0A8X6WSA6_9ARAC|nr:splicing factor 3B subunit [Trichonephila inaurata madagascariensis]